MGLEFLDLPAQLGGLGLEPRGLSQFLGRGRVVGADFVDSVGTGLVVNVGMTGAQAGGLSF